MTDPRKNPISFIQELCQKHSFAFPVYQEVGVQGSSHCPTFSIMCSFEGYDTVGSGTDKKSAKKEAASKMLAITNIGADLLKHSRSKVVKPYNKVSLLSETSNVDESDGKATTSENDVEVNKCNPIGLNSVKNPISLLMEYCQQRKIQPPSYFESDIINQDFIYECRLNGLKTYGQGKTKKSAKTESSRKMCEELKILTKSNGTLQETSSSLLTTKDNPSSLLQNLKEFDYDVDESADDEEEVKIQSTPTVDGLILDDSVVEIEPTRAKYLEGHKEERTVQSSVIPSIKELKLYKYEVEEEPSTLKQFLTGLEEEEKAIESTVISSIKQLNLDESDVEEESPTLKQILADCSVQKVPTSETLMKWVQKKQNLQ